MPTIDQAYADNAAGIGILERLARERAQEELERNLPLHRNQVFLEDRIEKVRTILGNLVGEYGLDPARNNAPFISMRIQTVDAADMKKLLEIGVTRFSWSEDRLTLRFSSTPLDPPE